MSGETDAFLRDILLQMKTIAMVGASDKENRPSFGVFEFLLSHGYHVMGVNPNLAGKTVHGTVFYKSLADVRGQSIWWIFTAIRKRPARPSTRRLRSIQDQRSSGCSSVFAMRRPPPKRAQLA
jgi:hypothetical protein